MSSASAYLNFFLKRLKSGAENKAKKHHTNVIYFQELSTEKASSYNQAMHLTG